MYLFSIDFVLKLNTAKVFGNYRINMHGARNVIWEL